MSHKNSDRLRTNWTLEMDRYFIDLMLDQVGKGNKIDDHLFSKRSWKQMTLLFNTKFKFDYEKDVLKNRHKTLRNLYKTISNLLAVNGFTWDYNRQMVTADNKVWDDYIKVHPNARSYRIKTIPYYYDLCRIYTNTTLETEGPECVIKSSPESINDAIFENDDTDLEVLHEIMIDEDFRVSICKDFNNDIISPVENDDNISGGNRVRTYWQPPMDRYFIDLMVDQIEKGNQIDGLFRKQAWIEMITLFNERFGFKFDVDILKNRYKTFKRQYNVIKKILESRGFFWDDLRKMVIADDRVWQDYIEKNSDARQYMTRPVPYYNDLCIICKEVNTDENDTLSDNQSNQNGQLSVSGASSHELNLKRELALANEEIPENLKKTKMDDESMINALREMANAVSCLVEKSKDEGKMKNSFDVENVIEAIQGLPDMDEDLILDACDLLEDDKKAKTFLALDVKLRRKWLIRKLRPEVVV